MLQQISSASDSFSTMFPEPWGVVDVSTGSEHPRVTCSLHLDELWFSALVCVARRSFGERWDKYFE